MFIAFFMNSNPLVGHAWDVFDVHFCPNRSRTYVTITFDVFFMSWDNFITLFLQIPAEAAVARWR